MLYSVQHKDLKIWDLQKDADKEKGGGERQKLARKTEHTDNPSEKEEKWEEEVRE